MQRAPIPPDRDTLLSRRELAAMLTISEKTLARWASDGLGPKAIRIGPRRVAYRVGDLRDWLASAEPASPVSPCAEPDDEK